MSQRIDYCGEGPLDAVLARRLIAHVGAVPGIDYVTPRRPRGVRTLDSRLAGLLIAARNGQRILVLRDLDQDAPCAGMLMARLQPQPTDRFCLRIAVRAAEAWLLADRDGIAKALSVARGTVPPAPETLLQPKALLADLGRRSARRDVVRAFEGGLQARSAWVAEFIADHWSIARALRSRAAPSLNSAVLRLQSLAK